MKQHPVIQALGKVCNTCKYYDAGGYCSKKCEHRNCCSGSCEKWKIAEDLKQSYPRKSKVERVQLLDPQQTKCKQPTSQELEDFFNDA